MRVLHTADWHLGQRFMERDRTQEHKHFLDWLLDTVETQRVDCLVMAGDVFDTAHPSHENARLYYQFLSQLVRNTRCRQAVIVAGNHDSAGFLAAPAAMLQSLGIHVIGHCGQGLDHCLTLAAEDGPGLMVAAIPFLRDADLQTTIRPGMSTDEIALSLRQSIASQYQRAWEHCHHARQAGMALMATGHLFAAGGLTEADLSDDRAERTIHIGNLGRVMRDDMDFGFDYIALGHIHKAQVINGQDHIRYAGSPIALSFSEANYANQVQVLDFDRQGRLHHNDTVAVGCERRRLLRLKGSYLEVVEKLNAGPKADDKLKPWVEITLTDNQPLAPQEREAISPLAESKGLEVLRVGMPQLQGIRLDLPGDGFDSLQALRPTEVFDKLCEKRNIGGDRKAALDSVFHQILEAVQ